ncbi:hypothetical protein B296_00009091 [Ensete ventricosum]|uniref:Uncharacterized protein n=1 Tax=Ensete ventricosum TaxID=4639 RepID=A0A427AQ12_ENSVE|nr:hypothetical protein B296_00009091 [Ensete ventricosum]
MGSSPMVTDRVVVPRGEMESLVNSIKAEAIRVRSLIRLSFWKASRYSTLAKLSMSIITLFTRMLDILTEITKVSSWSEAAPEVPPTDKLLDMTKDDLSRSHHIRVEPRRVVGNAQHIKALEVPYRAIWARNEMTCSTESEPPS